MQYIHINTDTGELRVWEEPLFDNVWTIYEVDDSYQLEVPLALLHNGMYLFEHIITDLSKVERIYTSTRTMKFDFPDEDGCGAKDSPE